jgi:electron transfer flavoprotein alpha subunit
MGQARELADQVGIYVYAVLVGADVDPLTEDLIAYGADKVLTGERPALSEYQPEVWSGIIGRAVEQYRPEILLLSATSLGNDLAPRLAQRLGCGLMSHCIKVEMDMSERVLLGTGAVLGGEVYRTYACPQARPQMATLEPGLFRVPGRESYRSGSVENLDLDPDPSCVSRSLEWVDLNAAAQLPPVPLSMARIVVSAGRGMGDEQGFALVEELAGRIGGVVAGSRGAFDEGWISEDRIVGVGGETIRPDLYIACGLSGDIYHYHGVQDAKFIVAINKDAASPIARMANLVVVGDAREVIPAMIGTLDA